jgi:hypothetical protein
MIQALPRRAPERLKKTLTENYSKTARTDTTSHGHSTMQLPNHTVRELSTRRTCTDEVGNPQLTDDESENTGADDEGPR